MVEVPSELIYEVLKQIRDEVVLLKHGQGELKSGMQAFLGHMIAMQQDIHNTYTTLYRYGDRLDPVAPATA